MDGGAWRAISLGEGNGNPLQYSCLENPMDEGAWWAIVHWVARGGYNLATKPMLATTIANSKSQTLNPVKIYFCLTVTLLYLIAMQSGIVSVCGGGVIKRNERSKPP